MLRNIYLKEMKDCFRDRRTLLLTVLLPIVMMTALTLFYDKMLSEGKGETYTLAVSSSVNNEITSVFSSYKNIDIIPSSNPEKSVREGKAQAALIIPESFADDIENGTVVSVELLGDSFSQKSSNLLNLVKTAFSGYEKKIISERLDANGIDSKLIKPFNIREKRNFRG